MTIASQWVSHQKIRLLPKIRKQCVVSFFDVKGFLRFEISSHSAISRLYSSVQDKWTGVSIYPNRVLEIGLFMFRNRESQMRLLVPGSIRNRVPSTVVRMGILRLWRREMSDTIWTIVWEFWRTCMEMRCRLQRHCCSQIPVLGSCRGPSDPRCSGGVALNQ